jgi:hypothetical protein
VKIQLTLKTLIKRSQQLPEMFEIVLRPSWWAAGNEQPSPPREITDFLYIMICICQNTSVAGRQPPGEEVGIVARFQPPTNLAVEQFRTFQVTAGTFLSMF